MRTALGLVLAFVFGAAFVLGFRPTPAERPAMTFEAQMRAEAAPTVRLLKGANGGCSAVVVAPGYALTAAHCEQALEPKVDGHPVAKWRRFSAKDVALVEVPGLACPCAVVGKPAAAGERVAIIGFPAGLGLALAYGESQGAVFYEDERHTLVTIPVTGGMSGGGTFVLRDGRVWLVAITSKGAPGSTLVVPVEGLQPNLKGL